MILKLLISLIANADVLLKILIKVIDENEKRNKTNKQTRKIREDLQAIDKAWADRDASILNSVFNGVPNHQDSNENREPTKT